MHEAQYTIGIHVIQEQDNNTYYVIENQTTNMSTERQRETGRGWGGREAQSYSREKGTYIGHTLAVHFFSFVII